MHTPEKLEAHLHPPVPAADWAVISEGLRARFEEMWLIILGVCAGRRRKANNEIVDFAEIYQEGDPIWISMAVSEIRRVRTEAERLFQKAAIPLYGMRIPSNEQQRRHFPPRVMTRDEVIEKSWRGPSLFFSGIRVEHLQLVLWNVLEQRFWDIVRDKHRRVDIHAINDIGASRGGVTPIIRFDLHMASRTAHGFPIPAADADVIHRDGDSVAVSSDILQGFERFE